MSQLKNKFFIINLLLIIFCSHAWAERGDRDKPIHMEADRVVVDDANQISTFEGHVRLQQGTLLIEADKILLKQDDKGNSQITATGSPSHFKQKRDGVNEFAEGFGERIEYDSQAETANIYGQARVKREGDDVRGEHIIYSTKTGVFQVYGNNEKSPEKNDQGRVTIVIQPKNKTGEVPAGTDAASSTPQTQQKP